MTYMSLLRLVARFFFPILFVSLVFSGNAQAWVYIDSFQLNETEVIEGEELGARVTVSNIDSESHYIHFRGLLVDENGDYVRDDDGSGQLVFIDMDCCLSLYNIWGGETVDLDLKIKTYNLPLGNWTSEIGVLIYDEDDYVSDSTKTEKFEIVEESFGTDVSSSIAGFCGLILIVGIIAAVVAIKQNEKTKPSSLPVQIFNPNSQSVNTAYTSLNIANIKGSYPLETIPVVSSPNTTNASYLPENLPSGGEFKQVGDVFFYMTPDGRSWVKQSDGTYIQT